MSGLDSLESLYQQLLVTGELPDDVWDEWLWRTDPEEEYKADVLMNRCHLLGFLVCLCKGLQSSEGGGGKTGSHMPTRLVLMDTPVAKMTLRELQDTVGNLQFEWPAFVSRLPDNPCAQANLDAVLSLIDQCVSRFGVLCLSACGGDVLDDPGSVELEGNSIEGDSVEGNSVGGNSVGGNLVEGSSVEGVSLLRVSRATIRRMVSTFLVVYRHLHLLAVCVEIPPKWRDLGITKYHMEASSDDFNLICMHMSLPVAAKLNYRHDFPGMYNHVSQAVFFHNNEYQRINRAELGQLKGASVEHVLPALMQLHPDIGLRYEDDCVNLSEGGGGKGEEKADEWFWLVVAGRVYLVDPDRQVYYSSDVTSLLGVYLDRLEVSRGSPSDRMSPDTDS
jgi:hypothetical protein